MLFNTNILFLFFTVLPVILYSFVVFLNTPYGCVSLKTGYKFLGIGVISPLIVLGVHFLFPNWLSKIETGEAFLSILIFAFIQVAFLEEFSKYLIFKLTTQSNNDLNPISILYYCMMTSAGFALLENFHYVEGTWSQGQQIIKSFPGVLTQDELNDTVWTVILLRSVTAIITHMITGAIMGYFIGLSILDTKIKTKSNLTIFLRRNTKYKKIYYTTLGIICATLFHGLYDFNLMYSREIGVENSSIRMFAILLAGLYITYKMGKHLSLETEEMMLKKTFNED